MLKQFSWASLTFFLLMIIMPALTTLQAQSFDYESYPKLDFNFTHLELNLGLQPQNLNIDGAATYQLEANVSGADTITLYAARLDISSVTIDDEQADFSLHNDSLFISLSQPTEEGDTHELYIRYSGSPTFGLLKNANGTVWTSQLPKAQRHWVPIVDNPHVTLQTSFNISLPSGYTVQATGRKISQEAASVDVMSYHFATEEEVPASALSFTAGRFYTDSITAGNQNLALSVEQHLADSVDSRSLLQWTAQNIQAIGNELNNTSVPGDLNIILLEDHTWETKSWGASTIYLYANRGNLQSQLLRGLLGQWYGVYQRETQWNEADIMTLHQVLTQSSIADTSALLAVKDTPEDSLSTVYNKFSPQQWNAWQEGLENWGEEALKDVVSDDQATALNEVARVVNWDDYAKYWYRQSGQPLFDPPSFSWHKEGAPGNGGAADSIAYEVVYRLNDTEDQLTLTFSALNGSYEKLTTLRAFEVYSNKTDTSEVTFTGSKDSVIVQVSPIINTVNLEAPEGLNLRLEEYKPPTFLLYELRNAETVEARAQAARKLGYHQDDADLQLAIRDFMNRDVEPQVRAALLRSLADITQGASGTEETFLKALDSQNRQIRDAALMALQYFTNNPAVFNRVEQVAVNADSMSSFKRATQVLTTLASADEFGAFAETIIQRDTTGHRAVFAVQEMANMGAVDEAVEKASHFLEPHYTYEIRSRGLQILIQHDETPANWLHRAEELLTDSDPRIRFLFARALEGNMNQDIVNYLKEHIQDEYDERVYMKIEKLISSN